MLPTLSCENALDSEAKAEVEKLFTKCGDYYYVESLAFGINKTQTVAQKAIVQIEGPLTFEIKSGEVTVPENRNGYVWIGRINVKASTQREYIVGIGWSSYRQADYSFQLEKKQATPWNFISGIGNNIVKKISCDEMTKHTTTIGAIPGDVPFTVESIVNPLEGKDLFQETKSDLVI